MIDTLLAVLFSPVRLAAVVFMAFMEGYARTVLHPLDKIDHPITNTLAILLEIPFIPFFLFYDWLTDPVDEKGIEVVTGDDGEEYEDIDLQTAPFGWIPGFCDTEWGQKLNLPWWI